MNPSARLFALFLLFASSTLVAGVDYQCSIYRVDYKFNPKSQESTFVRTEIGKESFGMNKARPSFTKVFNQSANRISYLFCFAGLSCSGETTYTCSGDELDLFIRLHSGRATQELISERMESLKQCPRQKAGGFLQPLTATTSFGDETQHFEFHRVMETFMTQYSVDCQRQ